MGSDQSNYIKFSPKQIIEWDMRHKNYRGALTEERFPNLLKLAKLYGAEVPEPVDPSMIKSADSGAEARDASKVPGLHDSADMIFGGHVGEKSSYPRNAFGNN